jgi:OHCU decarboxylase
MKLAQLNALDQRDFVATLADIFEHSPWVAEGVLPLRPFDSVQALHAAMCAVVDTAEAAAQLGLIRAHPQLAGKAAIAGDLTAASSQEQSGAGLLHCSPAEYARLGELNAAYQQRFGFPFILAVRGHDRASIIANLDRRLASAADAEHAEALRQIGRIAAFRLEDLLHE